MWPSTLMQLNVSSTTSPSIACAVAVSSGASVRTTPSIVAMLRADHGGALGHAGDLNLVRPPSVTLPAGQLVRRVGRQHAARGGHERVFVVASCSAAALDARRDLVHRQKLADDAGRQDEGLLALGAAGRRRPARPSRAASRQAALAGAGVGVARVDDDRANVARPACALDRAPPARRRRRFCV